MAYHPGTNQAAVIFRPGAASSGYFVQTWNEVQQAIAQAEGCIDIYVDSSLAAAHVPAASTISDGHGRAKLLAAAGDQVMVLTVDDGATLKDFTGVGNGLVLEVDTKSATPALDFTWANNPKFTVDELSALLSTATATQPACNVPAASFLNLLVKGGAEVFMAAAQPIFSVAATGDIILLALGFVVLRGDFIIGPGTLDFYYDSSAITATVEGGGSNVPAFAGVGVVNSIQTDTHAVTMTFNATTANVLGVLASVLPATGNLFIRAEGFGGSAGAGGGQGGAAGTPGGGGAGGGGCIYSQGGFVHNLAHPLNVTIGAGGAGGAGGAAGGGAGGAGIKGNATACTDGTSGVNLVAFPGSGPGSPGSGTRFGGSSIANLASITGATTVALPSFGGSGGAGAAAGTVGSVGTVSFNPTATLFWAGGTGGTSAGGLGGGGGGGGAGPFAAGGAGGNGIATGSPGNPGANATANAGNGPGGGAGGAAATDAGGKGGDGAAGFLRLSFLIP